MSMVSASIPVLLNSVKQFTQSRESLGYQLSLVLFNLFLPCPICFKSPGQAWCILMLLKFHFFLIIYMLGALDRRKQTGFLCLSKSMIQLSFTLGREKLFPKYLHSLCFQKSVNYWALIINMNYICIKTSLEMKYSDWPLKYQISLWKKVLSCLFFYFNITWGLKLELNKNSC